MLLDLLVIMSKDIKSSVNSSTTVNVSCIYFYTVTNLFEVDHPVRPDLLHHVVRSDQEQQV